MEFDENLLVVPVLSAVFKIWHSTRSHTRLMSQEALRRTVPRGSASAGMGPKWSAGVVIMIRPLAALARPDRTARSVVNASSGRSAFLMRSCSARDGCWTPCGLTDSSLVAELSR